MQKIESRLASLMILKVESSIHLKREVMILIAASPVILFQSVFRRSLGIFR